MGAALFQSGSVAQILPKRLHQRSAERNDSILLALSLLHEQGAIFDVDMDAAEISQLFQANAGVEEGGENCRGPRSLEDIAKREVPRPIEKILSFL